MEFIEILLNLDQYLAFVVEEYGLWVYLILFLIIFSETGLVVTPFLPGDSLLFVVGAVASTGAMRIEIVLPLLFFAAVLGNLTNFQIGSYLGPKVFSKTKIPFLNRDSLEKTKKFYDKHGGKAIILSRFLPIFRTFVPFVAGIGKMNYITFFVFNIVGASLWVFAFTLTGYYFGNIPYVKNNFELIVIAILILSLLPILIKYTLSVLTRTEKVIKR